MIPKKLFWMLGYNNLALILEQERKHWLLKTDANKQIQDSITGDMFQGQINNLGADILIESKKLPYKYDFATSIQFGLTDADKILKISNSAFPHSACVNGLMFARVISTNYPFIQNDEPDHNHYKITFTNATECILPFGASTSSDEVYADKWIKTSTPPTLKILNRSTGEYSITRQLTFDSEVTNPVWYYPLTETLQPFEMTDLGYGSYELQAVNDDGFIGYPLFWFTCDQSNVGSNLTFDSNNINSRNEQIFFVSNAGNASPFDALVYTGIDGNCDTTPDGTDTSNYVIKCTCKLGDSFNGTDVDFNKALDSHITLTNTNSQQSYSIEFIFNDNDKLTMNPDTPWTYDDSNDLYYIDMSYFDQNCLNGEYANTPLVPVFRMTFDNAVPFVQRSTDVGIAGIRMGSSNLVSDVYEKYPYNLNRWEGLPSWLNDLEDGCVSEHFIMYAFHQPPTYDPENPETMQGAGIIIDPGKHEVEGEEPNTDNIGRVYVLSNDDTEYRNNAEEEFPKPARTAARMCDIPTSVVQLSGTTGLSPDPVVDKKYVRTEANFYASIKDRIYNDLPTRWVRPTALSYNGQPVWSELGFNNKFAFEGVKTLEYVDMYDHNNFRETLNLNPMVDTAHVHLKTINAGGSGYVVNDQGVCIVGGYAFTYVVLDATPIDEHGDGGAVTEAVILPPAQDASLEARSINLSNFDMDDSSGGLSEPYGTSPTSGSGRGLRISFMIDYDYYQSILPKKGEFFDDLFAFVREKDGTYVYAYTINQSSLKTPKEGKWYRGMKVSEYEITSTKKEEGGVATSESFINSILPSLRQLPVTMNEDNIDPTKINVLQTASFVNVVDDTKTPVMPPIDDPDPDISHVVDINKFYCDGFITNEKAQYKTFESVIKRLKEINALRFDSYVLWRWNNTTADADRSFTYGIVYRGFSNLQTTDTSTMLPTNELTCDNYVHTNGNTTLVWNVPGVGTMLWVYDPKYTKKEEYYIDPETMELHVHREDMSFNNIDIRIGESTEALPKIIDDNGKFTFNIATNNPIHLPSIQTVPIYKQPEMTQFPDMQINRVAADAEHGLCGGWRLVFPRINSFRLSNDATQTEWIPKKMQTIKGRNIGDIGSVVDEDGNDVSIKSLIIDESNDGTHLRIFNSATHTWDEV